MVLHEKRVDFEVREVDLSNKSEEFLAASPTGKVPVVVMDGDSLYESNVINQYLEERLKDRVYLADEFSLADIAHAGAFVGLRNLEERGEISLDEYPNVTTWIRRLESRESYKCSKEILYGVKGNVSNGNITTCSPSLLLKYHGITTICKLWMNQMPLA